MKKIDRQDILDIFNFRFATKEFDGRKVPQEDIETIVETARLSPSSFGLEPWKFMVIEDRELMDKMAEVSWGVQRQMPTTSHAILGLTRKTVDMRYDSEYIKDLWLNVKGAGEEIYSYVKNTLEGYQKNLFDLDNTDEKVLEWSRRQTYIAMGNMMTTAAMLGVDSCAIEGIDAKKIEEMLAERNLIDTDHFEVTYMIVFGYRKEEPHREKSRRDAKDIISWVK